MASIALFSLFLLPLLSILAPAKWRIHTPARWNAAKVNSTADVPSRTARSEVETPDKGNASSVSQAKSTTVMNAQVADPRQTATMSTPSRAGTSMLPVLVGIWIASVWILSFRQAFGLFGLWMLATRGCEHASNELRDRIKALPGGEIVTHCVRLIVDKSDRRAVPVTWGVFRPVLLLPGDIESWPNSRFRPVMIHELEHIRRYDWLLQTLALSACILYCFNPLAWYLHRRLMAEAEFACDDAVMRVGLPAPAYAQTLLDVVNVLKGRRTMPAAIGVFGRYPVTKRIEAILARGRRRDRISPKIAVSYVAVASLVLCGAVALRPAAARETAPAQATYTQEKLDQIPMPDRGPSGKTITLGSGIGVELIAVGVAPTANGSNWWSPEGDVLPEPPARVRNQFHYQAIDPGDKYVVRTLCFRLHSAVKTDASTTGYVVDPTHHLDTEFYLHGRDIRLNDAHLLPKQSAVGNVDLKLPPSEKVITYRFGIASGNWQTVASIKKDDVIPRGTSFLPASAGGFEPRLELSPSLSLLFRDSAGEYRTLLLLNAAPPLGDVARRVIAFDREGREITLGRDETGYSTEGLGIQVETLERVHEFRIQTRPYEWAEFIGVAVQPKAAILPFAPTPASLPQYRHTFACGLTMEVPAVTLPNHGGQFWRPDGKLVPGPLKEYARTLNPVWSSEIPMVLFRISASKTTTFTTAREFLPAVNNNQGVVQESYGQTIAAHEAVSSIFSAVYPRRNMPSEMTIRYGVATSPWKTIGTVQMPQDVLHNAAIPDYKMSPKFGEDLSIDLFGRVSLKFATGTGQAQTRYFMPVGAELGAGARRILAIDKQGAETIVNFFSEGQKLQNDQIVLSFHSSGMLAERNRFDLFKIKEFRLQTRPYEWAEFKHIQLAPK